VWNDAVKNSKEYKKYKVKSGVKVAMGSISLIVSAILTGVGGWTGAGTVIGIIGLIRSASTLGQQIYQLAIEAETVLKGLKADLSKLEDRYKDASKNAVGGQEVALKVWPRLRRSNSTAFPSVKGRRNPSTTSSRESRTRLRASPPTSIRPSTNRTSSRRSWRNTRRP
jgi:hypothetical protein